MVIWGTGILNNYHICIYRIPRIVTNTMVVDSSIIILVGVVQNRPGEGCWYLFRPLLYKALSLGYNYSECRV